RSGHPAVADELSDDPVDHVDRDGETYPGVGARGRKDRGVDADQPSGRIEQGAARIPRVDGRVGLDHFADLAARAGRQPPLERADPAYDHGLIETERIADHEGP